MTYEIRRIKELFRLDPATGKIYWKIWSGAGKPGKEAGTPDGRGYLIVGANYRSYYVHRIVFLLTYGRWPVGVTDHIDQDKTNNKPDNLREATHGENMMNSKVRKDNKSGHRGVYFNNREGKWDAKKRGKLLGSFDNKEAAIEARENAL